jgi:hypothetical protein
MVIRLPPPIGTAHVDAVVPRMHMIRLTVGTKLRIRAVKPRTPGERPLKMDNGISRPRFQRTTELRGKGCKDQAPPQEPTLAPATSEETYHRGRNPTTMD